MKLKLSSWRSRVVLSSPSHRRPAQAQVYYGRYWGGRRWRTVVETPAFYYGSGYQPAVYGRYGPGIYNSWGSRFYGLPDYPAAMSLYGFPNPFTRRIHHTPR